MDTPHAAVVHKENAHIGGGNTTVTMKPDKLKTTKTVGKKCKAFEDLPIVGASKNVNLKKKSTKKGNEVRKNQMTKGKQSKSVLQGFGKGNKPFDHISIDDIKQHFICSRFNHTLTDEELKKCYEWVKAYKGHLREFCRGFEKFIKKPNKSKMVLLPGSNYRDREPFTSEEKAYERDELDFKTSIPGRLSSNYIPKELNIAELFPDEYDPFQELKELKLNEDY